MYELVARYYLKINVFLYVEKWEFGQLAASFGWLLPYLYQAMNALKQWIFNRNRNDIIQAPMNPEILPLNAGAGRILREN